MLKEYSSYQLGVYLDDAKYVILARSLLESNRYGLINGPGAPTEVVYPFGFPLLLTPFLLLVPDALDAPKALSLVATFANSALLFWGWRYLSPSLPSWLGLVVSVLYLYSPQTVGLVRMVLSDPIFLTGCLSSIILTEYLARRGRSAPLAIPLLCLGVSLALVISTRTIGVTLVVACGAYLAVRRGAAGGWIALRAMVVMACLLGLVVVLTSAEPQDLVPGQYVNGVSSSPTADEGREPSPPKAVVLLNSWQRYLFVHVRHLLFPVGAGSNERALASVGILAMLPTLFATVVLVVLVLGYWRWLVSDAFSLFSVFPILYGGAIMAWPYSDERYLYPVGPQLYVTFLIGALTAAQVAIRNIARQELTASGRWIVATPFVLVMLILALYRDLKIDDSRLHVGDLQQRTAWLRMNSDVSDVVLTDQPEVDYLYSGRKTVRIRPASSSTELEAQVLGSAARYVLLAPDHRWQEGGYAPTYGDETVKRAVLLEQLAGQGVLQEAYVEPDSRIRVFRRP